MPELLKIPFVGGNTEELQNIIDPAQTINLYQVVHPTKRYMRTMPGLSEALVEFAGKDNVRQLYTKKDKMYAVAKDTIYQINTVLGSSVLGAINTLSGYVGIASNQTQIIFVDGDKGYIFDIISTAFSEITDPAFPTSPIDVTFQDGFFIVAHGNSNQWSISALNDGLTWDALDFESIQSEPDLISGARSFKRQLFIFGLNVIEPWYNAGATDFPFRRNNGLLLEFGSVARGAIARGHGRLFWIGGDRRGVGSIFMTDGTQPVVISTPAIDAQLQTYSNIDQARGYVYKYDGHLFYDVSFTDANVTWTFDANLRQWYKRQMAGENRFIADCHTFFNNKHYVGAYNIGELYEMSSDFHKYIDSAIARVRISEPIKDELGRKMEIDQLIIDILPGQGTINPSDSEPELLISWSKQGGLPDTFELPQRVALGKIGRFGKRLSIERLGVSGGNDGLGWVFKFEFYGNVPFLLGDAVAVVEYLST